MSLAAVLLVKAASCCWMHLVQQVNCRACCPKDCILHGAVSAGRFAFKAYSSIACSVLRWRHEENVLCCSRALHLPDSRYLLRLLRCCAVQLAVPIVLLPCIVHPTRQVLERRCKVRRGC